MRGVLAHMTQCNEGRNCTVAHCASSRQIIEHWKNCTKPDCPVCYLPRNQNSTLNQRIGAPSQPGQNRLMSNATLGGPVTGPDPAGLSASVLNASQTSTVFMQHQPQQPREHKPWHEKITTDMRRHLVQKIVQTIFPTQDPNIYRDPRLTNLVKYAVKTECEMYEQARDQEEYFHLLDKRICNIQQEFEYNARLQDGRAKGRVDEGSGQNGSLNFLNLIDSYFAAFQTQPSNTTFENTTGAPFQNQPGSQLASTDTSAKDITSLINCLNNTSLQAD